jgi:signal transduction histidine kinase
MKTSEANNITGSFWYSTDLSVRILITTWVSIIIVLLISLLDLAGLVFDLDRLQSFGTYWIKMKEITAITFVLSAISLLIIKSGLSRSKKLIVRGLIIYILLAALISITDHLFFMITGREAVRSATPILNQFLLPENRMSLLTACNFLIMGLIFFLFSKGNATSDNIAHILVFPAGLTSYYVLVSYILNMDSIHEISPVPVSLNSGIASCLLCLAILLMRPDTWLMKEFTSRRLGGIMVRWLLPGLIALPIIIGKLRIFGENTGFYSTDTGKAIVAVTYTICFILLLWMAARSVNKTDEKRLLFEEALLKSYGDLEYANNKLNKELKEHSLAEEALKKREIQLGELIATKDKFFNIIAHDLKNPFTSLLGSTELLSNNISQLNNEEIRKLAEIINESSKSGYAILQNLLDWSRSQTGLLKINPEKINLKQLIDENVSNLKLYAANKEIAMQSYHGEDKDINIFTDKNMLNTVLRNLISNAIKFTHRNGNVKVGISRDDDEVTISVKDTGTGISEENIEKLFRLDTRFQLPGTDNEQGTGLGLKLSKEFVGKLGGRIWVESVENKGSEFKFTIPVVE